MEPCICAIVIGGILGLVITYFLSLFIYKNEACPISLFGGLLVPALAGFLLWGESYSFHLTALIVAGVFYALFATINIAKIFRKPELRAAYSSDGCGGRTKREGRIWILDFIQAYIFSIAAIGALVFALLIEGTPM